MDLFPSIEEGRVVVDTLHANSRGDRGDVSIQSVTTPHIYDSNDDSNDDDFVANDDVPAPEAWPTAEFKEGPAVGPTAEFQEGPVAPTLPLDSDWYKNRTVEEVDAHFALVIAASLKAREEQPSTNARSSPQMVQFPLLKPMTICRPFCLQEFAIAMLLLKLLSHLVQAVAVKAAVSSATQIKLHLVSCHPP